MQTHRVRLRSVYSTYSIITLSSPLTRPRFSTPESNICGWCNTPDQSDIRACVISNSKNVSSANKYVFLFKQLIKVIVHSVTHTHQYMAFKGLFRSNDLKHKLLSLGCVKEKTWKRKQWNITHHICAHTHTRARSHSHRGRCRAI